MPGPCPVDDPCFWWMKWWKAIEANAEFEFWWIGPVKFVQLIGFPPKMPWTTSSPQKKSTKLGLSKKQQQTQLHRYNSAFEDLSEEKQSKVRGVYLQDPWITNESHPKIVVFLYNCYHLENGGNKLANLGVSFAPPLRERSGPPLPGRFGTMWWRRISHGFTCKDKKSKTNLNI